MHYNMMLAHSPESALHLYIKEPRRKDTIIPSILRRLNARLEEAKEYEMIDVNDFMTEMTNNQRHQYLLNVQGGMSCPFIQLHLG